MDSFLRKALASLICLTMIFTVTTGITFAADDTSASGTIKVTDLSGKTVTITEEDITSAQAKEVNKEEPWGFNNNATQVYGKFYNFKDLLSSKGITDLSNVHGLKVVATDGFASGYTAEEFPNVYIYIKSEVNDVKSDAPYLENDDYGMAINGSEGNKWAKGVASVDIAQTHFWMKKKGACRHTCGICGEAEPTVEIDGTTFHVGCEKEFIDARDVEAKVQAEVNANEIAVKATAKATAYNKVTLTWSSEIKSVGISNDKVTYKVEKNSGSTWKTIDASNDKLVVKAEPGIKNYYRVSAGYHYTKPSTREDLVAFGKPVSVSATTGLAKASISKVTTKSKKIT
ncbi:MAG: hypothetical protein Q4B78_01880, partial [Bacillota bacterium]|nr:hypothetical protein [Bacillota bacterium]